VIPLNIPILPTISSGFFCSRALFPPDVGFKCPITEESLSFTDDMLGGFGSSEVQIATNNYLEIRNRSSACEDERSRINVHPLRAVFWGSFRLMWD
jgi:hypothetical protein